jgi:hypothetical protein
MQKCSLEHVLKITLKTEFNLLGINTIRIDASELTAIFYNYKFVAPTSPTIYTEAFERKKALYFYRASSNSIAVCTQH